MIKIYSFLLFLFSFILFSSQISAIDSNRFATIINPVRSRSLWSDQSLKPLIDQYHSINSLKLPATWLLQYDTFFDQELRGLVTNFNSDQELGIFLEISPSLAKNAKVIYPVNRTWYDPSAIFLSGYSRKDRTKIIDTLWSEFKNTFGYYPQSVGAWWLDSYSLNYISKKYGLKTVMIVADQKTTDSYGVWGQWWGVPYYPSSQNILIPETVAPKLPIVIQWAQRDPVLGYGEGKSSLYSLQANDYFKINQNIGYFKKLVDIYLHNSNPYGQITVGLETGMESLGHEAEFHRQLEYLKSYPNLNIVTASGFGDNIKQISPKNPDKMIIGDWVMTPQSRSNPQVGETINYQPTPWSDFYSPDQNSFLNRVLPQPKIEAPKPNIPIVKIITVIVFVLLGLRLSSASWLVWLPLTFSLDWLVSLVRYTVIDGQRYLGVVFDTFTFIGLPRIFTLSNLQAQTLISFPFDKIWWPYSLIFLLFLAFCLSKILQQLKK